MAIPYDPSQQANGYNPMPVGSGVPRTAAGTISSGGTTSGAISVRGGRIAAFYPGAAFTGTTITLQASVDGGTTFLPVYTSAGAAISYTVAAGHLTKFDPPLEGYDYVKVVSGSTEGANRTVTLALAP